MEIIFSICHKLVRSLVGSTTRDQLGEFLLNIPRSYTPVNKELSSLLEGNVAGGVLAATTTRWNSNQLIVYIVVLLLGCVHNSSYFPVPTARLLAVGWFRLFVVLCCGRSSISIPPFLICSDDVLQRDIDCVGSTITIRHDV